MTEEITSAEAPTPGPVGKGTRKLEGWEKSAVEFGPLAAFFAGYVLDERLGPVADGLFGTAFFAAEGNELFLALALFLPAFALAFAWSAYRTRRVAPVLAVTAAVVGVLGVLTFVFRDERFIYVKPTIVYGLTAIVLAGGLLSGRNFLKLLFDGAFELPEGAWRTLTWRFVLFNAAAAVANEVLWRTLTADCAAGEACGGRDLWVNVKVFGFTLAYFAFILSQAPFLMRHMKEPAAKGPAG
jgi:intracellular septation protein